MLFMHRHTHTQVQNAKGIQDAKDLPRTSLAQEHHWQVWSAPSFPSSEPKGREHYTVVSQSWLRVQIVIGVQLHSPTCT